MCDRFLMGVLGLVSTIKYLFIISQEGNMNGLVIYGVGVRQAA